MGDFTSPIGAGMGFGQAEGLLVRLREGDDEAFAAVFELYKDMVHTLCCKLLTDKAEAMDVTQEVFLTLHRKIQTFRGECSLKTWLYRVTLNQAANRNRWWKRRFYRRSVPLTLNLGDSERPLELASNDPSPHRRTVSAELSKAIQEALTKLPFEQRAAVVLRDVQGLTYEEIAEIAGVRIGTVKSRLARGRERLREALRNHRPGGPS